MPSLPPPGFQGREYARLKFRLYTRCVLRLQRFWRRYKTICRCVSASTDVVRTSSLSPSPSLSGSSSCAEQLQFSFGCAAERGTWFLIPLCSASPLPWKGTSFVLLHCFGDKSSHAVAWLDCSGVVMWCLDQGSATSPEKEPVGGDEEE